MKNFLLSLAIFFVNAGHLSAQLSPNSLLFDGQDDEANIGWRAAIPLNFTIEGMIRDDNPVYDNQVHTILSYDGRAT